LFPVNRQLISWYSYCCIPSAVAVAAAIRFFAPYLIIKIRSRPVGSADEAVLGETIMATEPNQQPKTSKRGFASMDPAKQREIASKGGRAAHAQGKAHEFTSEEARAAGRKGGEAAHARGTAHEFTSEEARQAGQKGGQHSRAHSRNISAGAESQAGSPALNS
jgi:general stress protein YciG